MTTTTSSGEMDSLIERCFALGPEVRYVAVYRGGELRLRERAGIAGASASDSDRYEELIDNPTLITLARQRGEIDCGGLAYLIVRYGNFFAFVHPLADGHFAVALETDADLTAFAKRIQAIAGEIG